MKSEFNSILVTGSHRSGTTFVGKMLTLQKAIAYIQEPFNPDYGVKGFDTWYTYTKAGAHNESHIERQIKSIFSREATFKRAPILKSDSFLRSLGKIALKSKSNIAYQQYKYSPYLKRLLFKDPIAAFSTEWLHKKFTMDVVIVIRHPAAFVASIKRTNDIHPLSELLRQDELMSDFLFPYASEMRSANSLISEGAILWKCIYSVLDKYCQRNPGIISKRHEDISLDPISEFRDLYDRLSIPFDKSVESKIRFYTDPENPTGPVGNRFHALKRDSAGNAYRWKNLLTQNEVSIIKEITRDVAEKYYTNTEW